MIKQIMRVFTMVLILMLGSNNVIAQTEILKGRVYVSSTKSLLPLGNGDGVLSLMAVGMAALTEKDLPSIFELACVGMGLEDEESKADIDLYCTFRKNQTDSFDIRGDFIDGSGGTLEIIGGSGKYSGATGSGNYKPIDPSASGEEGQGIIELQIITR